MSTAASRTLVSGVQVTSRRLSMSAAVVEIEILPGSNGDHYVALGNDAMNLIALSHHQGTPPSAAMRRASSRIVASWPTRIKVSETDIRT